MARPSLTQAISRLRKHPDWDLAMQAGRENPALAGGALAVTLTPELGALGVNLGALYARWWWAPRRVAWRVSSETAALVAETGMGFVPPETPSSWPGGAIIVESERGMPLVGDVCALGAYRLAVQHYVRPGQERYWLVAITTSGRSWAQSLPCDLGPVNDRLAARGEVLGDLPQLQEHDPLGLADPLSLDERRDVLRVFQWLFAFSFFVTQTADWWRAEPAGDGPPARTSRGKVLREGGRVVPLWIYRRLVFDTPPLDDQVSAGAGAPLDKSSLTLRPVIVRPHWRRVGAEREPRLIGAYSAHRWHRPPVLGEKVTV